jgi:excisionase family DNA binding protein
VKRPTINTNQEPTQMDRMLNIDQVAERLGTSPRFVRRLVAERRIAFNKVGRHIRFNATDVERFIEAGRVEPWPSVS